MLFYSMFSLSFGIHTHAGRGTASRSLMPRGWPGRQAAPAPLHPAGPAARTCTWTTQGRQDWRCAGFVPYVVEGCRGFPAL